jgi:hypothetical protein
MDAIITWENVGLLSLSLSALAFLIWQGGKEPRQ